MAWFAISVQMLALKERQEMFGPRQVSRPVASTNFDWSVIMQREEGCHLVESSWTSKRRNKWAKPRYSSQYARLRDTLDFIITPKNFSAHFMPRQLRGPFEKITSQLSKALESG